MKKFKNSLSRIYVPIIAQIFLAVVSYRILSMMTFNPNRGGSDDSPLQTAMFVTVAVVTSILIGLGYDLLIFWILGGILLWIAAMVSGANHVPIQGSATWNMDWGIFNYYIVAGLISVMQLIIWILIKIIKEIYTTKKNSKKEK